MITLECWDLNPSPRGLTCGIYGFPGRYQLWLDHPDATDPVIEGTDAKELEREARRRGAIKVIHWYEL